MISPIPNSDDTSRSQSKPVHLVILIHGLFGSTANVATVAEELHYLHALPGSSSTSPGPIQRDPAPEYGGNDDDDDDDVDGEMDTVDQGGGREWREDSRSSVRRMEDGVEIQVESTKPTPSTRQTGSQDEAKGNGRTDELVVYACNSFGWGHTWDGIDINAQRAAKEVDGEIRRLEEEGKQVKWISVLGYSLGGLIARYLVGVLSARQGFFDRHVPAAFVTVATPHLGILKYGTTTNTIIHTIGRRLFSRSGRQMYCQDKDEDGRCLLEVMSDPDGIFVHALQNFNKVIIAANGCHDLTVPYPTASISLSDPFQDYAAGSKPLTIEIDEKNIVQSYSQPPSEQVVEQQEGDDGDIKVMVTVTKTIKDDRVEVPKRPMLPPFLLLRWPFTYALFFLLPFLVPLWFAFLACFMTLQSYRSAKRHKLLHNTGEHQPLLASALIPTSRPRHKHLASLRNSPDTTGTSTPPFELPPAAQPLIPLYLTSQQETIVRNLNKSLPGMERVVAWLPWAFNSHAVIIMRDYKRFPSQEAARGVVREIARRILEAT